MATDKETRAIRVTREQFDRIEDAWKLVSYHNNPRRLTDAYLIAWFAWAVYQVTDIDVRDISFSLEVAS
jgi:hypothetical protein